MAEGNLLVYGNTAINPPQNLILVIGRAANNNHPKLTNRVGSYDFQEHPTCGFWNMSFSTVAWAYSQHYHEYSCADLKKDCVKRKTSPILFADAVNVGVPHGQNVDEVIHKTKSTEFRQHFTNVFNHSIIQHVKLVIVAGWGIDEANSVRKDLYRYARQELRTICTNRNIPLVETRFMFGTNRPFIQERLQKEGKTALIAELVKSFLGK